MRFLTVFLNKAVRNVACIRLNSLEADNDETLHDIRRNIRRFVYYCSQSVSPVPSDEEIRKILIQRIDEAKQSVGIVVGVIEPSGRRIVSYGAVAKGDKRPLDGNTVFEIGSGTWL